MDVSTPSSTIRVTEIDNATPSTRMASPSGLNLLNSDSLSLFLATPTPMQLKTPKPKKKASIKVVDAKLASIVPQKRQKRVEENEDFEFRASPSFSSIFGPSSATNSSTRSTPAIGTIDLKKMIQDAISPLISEIRGLKNEIQQLKAKNAQTIIPTASQEQLKAAEKVPKPKPLKTLRTAISKEIANKTPTETSIPAQRPTYASILRKETQGPQSQDPMAPSAPWTVIKRKTKPAAQELAPTRAVEPSQRRIIFQRQKNAPKNANLPNLLLALNRAMKQWGLPDHIRLLKLGYTGTGAISGLLSEKAVAPMIIPTYSDSLIKVAIQYDINITGIDQAEQWHRLRVHRVLLDRYLNSENGLQLAREEIEATQGLNLPLRPY
jgi:hypothetical protein